MPFNPNIFDIAGGLQQGMMSAGASIAGGIEKLAERQQEEAKADKQKYGLVNSMVADDEAAQALGFRNKAHALSQHYDTVIGAFKGLALKQEKERYRDTLKQQAVANQYDVLREQAQEKRWADSLAQQKAEHTDTAHERTLSRLDAADARANDLNLRKTEGERNYALALDKASQDRVHFGSDLMGNPYATTFKDGKFTVHEKGDGASSLSAVDFDTALKTTNEAIALGVPKAYAAAMFKKQTGKDLPDSSQAAPDKAAKPATVFPAEITAPTAEEKAMQQGRIKEIQADIAEQDRIMAEVKANPKTTTLFTVGSSLGAAPQAGRPSYKYPLRADRERVWGRANEAKKALQAELDKLTK